jgi:hypothetical protein
LKDIQRLLAAFPPISGEPSLILHNYLMAAEDFSADDVEAAVTMYIKGSVPGFDGRFAPTAPMLATGCRKVIDERNKQAYYASFSAPRLPPPDIEKTDEQRARARAKMQAAIDNLSSATALDSAEALDASKARWEKVNTRFAPDMSEEAIMERLVRRERGWTTGNDYGDAA